jgi:hypothetical protein
MPRSEPEFMRKQGRRHVAWCNEGARKPYAKGVFIALELAEQAHEAHGLPYEPGLRAMEKYPPDRFTWICEEEGDANESVKVRDDPVSRLATLVRLFYGGWSA